MMPPCPLCSSEKTSFFFMKQGNRYYLCKDCRFVFSLPAVNPNFRNAITDFEPAYINYFGDQLHDKKNHDSLVKKLLKHSSLQGDILDVGSGSGKLVRHLRSQGYNAYGLEPSAALYDAYLGKEDFFFNTDVFSFRLQYPQRKFNAIILTDVLEHIDSPSTFMAAVSDMLLPGGLLFVSTPDTGSLFARLAGKRWHYYNRYHLSLFSGSNLSELMQRMGLECADRGKLVRHQSLYYIIKYGLNFVLHREARVPRFLEKLYVPVNLGDNQYCICKKL